jgi:nucleoside phosphorylase
MFKILLVEDTAEKVKNITKVLQKIEGIDLINFENVIDAVSAKKKLKETCYNLLILDIAIPPSKDKDIELDGGLKLLEEITRRSKYNVPTHIIGLTGEDEVFEKAKESFDKLTLNVIKYSESNIEWETNLLSGVKQFIDANNSAQNSAEEYNYDIAIICALQEELDANLDNDWDWKSFEKKNDDTNYMEATFNNSSGDEIRVIAAKAKRMGMSATSALASKMIHQFRPKHIVMTGIMAGVTDKVNLGDIVIPSPVWDWGSGKWVPEPENNTQEEHSLFLIDPFQFTVDGSILKPIEKFQNDDQFLFDLRKNYGGTGPKVDTNIHIGACASGASVLSDKKTFQKITKQHRKLLGIEMEAYGLFSAVESASRPKPLPVCIKSVVDFGDSKKSDNFHPYGSYVSAQFAKALMENIYDEDK